MLVAIFDRSIDYKSIVPYESPVEINRVETRFENRTRESKFSGECFYCHKTGHRQNVCRKSLADLERSSSRPQTSGLNDREKRQHNQISKDHEAHTSFKRSLFNNNYQAPSKRNDSGRSESKASSDTFLLDAFSDELLLEVDQECNAVECDSFSVDITKEPLMRMKVEAALGDAVVTMPALIDCGSTASFISPEKLPKPIEDEVRDFIDYGKKTNLLELRKVKLTMNSVTSTKIVNCALGRVKIKIGDWVNEHDFIFTNIKEAAILGLDFFRANGAKCDFENEKIFLKDKNKTILVFDGKNKNENVNKIETLAFPPQEVRLKQKVKLKANSENLINVKLDRISTNKTVHFIPDRTNEVDIKRCLIFASSVSEIDNDNSIYISAINFSDTYV